ncbi:hypothetical protein DL237_12610 [Pseudooceanicola sediminis]|uniref:LPS-assembly lipoprotein n=1 Tax=Pseudooceanicola sediminis TaxID=2211117 RepID=A0A399IYT2_9RHOB|nr:LPS assembly lipoprotein LptE [Pseudooceanicola sediminis]KAA2313370.1 hypothetical protein E0K93_14245 [Puniceibacterium sp. HSS470]RII38348.1 hypothetical protein DL237_12610 [Pseudooceanicola sediminis]|tara:strand:- start:20179 stop:20706 length:528 start_codon:yes stop_codon:yes gene_type:complete
MWSSDRRRLLKLLVAAPATLAALSACGFTPAYAPGGGADRLLNVTRLPDPDSGDSYILVRELEQRLGRPQSPLYDLGLKLSVSEAALAITTDGTTTRFNVVGDLSYTLRDIASGTQIGAGRVTNFSGYSATGTTVATQAAQRDAHKRLVIMLANMLMPRLIADAAKAPPHQTLTP